MNCWRVFPRLFMVLGLVCVVPIIGVSKTPLGVIPYGMGLFTASFILAIMIMPYAVSITRQVITMVPRHLKEAAYSLGATRTGNQKVVLPFSRSVFLPGILLALGRALGETMAVTMLIGNTHSIPHSFSALPIRCRALSPTNLLRPREPYTLLR